MSVPRHHTGDRATRPMLGRRALSVVACLSVLPLLLAVVGVQVTLALAPAVLLLVALAWGYYPAEALIARWARRGLRRGIARVVRAHWGSAPGGFLAAVFVPGVPLRGPPVLRVV